MTTLGSVVTDDPNNAISPNLFVAVFVSVGAVVALVSVVMITIFITLCVREWLRWRRVKQGKETDRVGLLKGSQEIIISDPEEEEVVHKGTSHRTVQIVKHGETSSSSSRPAMQAAQVPSSTKGHSAKSSLTMTKKGSQGDAVKNGGAQGLSQESSHKVKDVDAAEIKSRAQRFGTTFSYMKELSKSCPMTPDMIARHQFTDDVGNPLVLQYKCVPTNAIDSLNLTPVEKAKNRYRNVLPNPHSAVVLTDDGTEGSTYINANFIRNIYGEDKAYIATQGPMFETMADFWRMVWEQDVTVVVMLTGLIERARHKCVKYWPPSPDGHMTVTYGTLEVTNFGEETVPACYTITHLSVKCIKTGEQKTVLHFWCTAWPDFGIPTETAPILNLRSVVDSHRTPKSGPLVIHCSAGLGRSGTFIAIDMGSQQYDIEGVVNPLKYLCEMRQDRGGMIQTYDQYLFVHKALTDYMKK